MNGIEVITDNIILKSKRDVLRLHLYTKLLQNSVKASDTEIEVLMELYEFGGNFSGIEEEKKFFDICMHKKHRRSYDSIRNVVSKFVKRGIILKDTKHSRQLSELYIPRMDSAIIGLEYKIINNFASK